MDRAEHRKLQEVKNTKEWRAGEKFAGEYYDKVKFIKRHLQWAKDVENEFKDLVNVYSRQPSPDEIAGGRTSGTSDIVLGAVIKAESYIKKVVGQYEDQLNEIIENLEQLEEIKVQALLTYDETQVFDYKFGWLSRIDDEYTYEEIGTLINYSDFMVRQIRNTAFYKIGCLL